MLPAILFLALLLFAQVPTGKIIGSVVDDQATPLPGVSVEASSPSLVGTATAVTDADGVYRLLALTPGIYRVSFILQGFKPLVREKSSFN